MPDRPSIPLSTQREILIESGHRCSVCGEGCPLERAHIVSWRLSKDHSPENLICLCANCHGRADTENWGEITLREYKRMPWVRRRYVPGDETPTSIETVIIRIAREQGEVDEKTKLFVQFAVAAFLGISPNDVRIGPLEDGSVRVTVELPREDAERLLREYASVQPSLHDYLAPYVLLDVQRGMRDRERVQEFTKAIVGKFVANIAELVPIVLKNDGRLVISRKRITIEPVGGAPRLESLITGVVGILVLFVALYLCFSTKVPSKDQSFALTVTLAVSSGLIAMCLSGQIGIRFRIFRSLFGRATGAVAVTVFVIIFRYIVVE